MKLGDRPHTKCPLEHIWFKWGRKIGCKNGLSKTRERGRENVLVCERKLQGELHLQGHSEQNLSSSVSPRTAFLCVGFSLLLCLGAKRRRHLPPLHPHGLPAASPLPRWPKGPSQYQSLWLGEGHALINLGFGHTLHLFGRVSLAGP